MMLFLLKVRSTTALTEQRSKMFPQFESLSAVEQDRQILETLKRIWGYDQFRPLQGDVVRATLQRRDVLAILPTGAGKSLCFQLPALLREGLSLVISPLVALMENQVAALQSKNVSVALFHSERSRDQRQQVLTRLEHGQLKLLYLSPESLLTPAVWNRLLQISQTIQSITIDEAHCITQWGNSFRPVYRRLGTVRPALQTQQPIPIAAFTATADAKTQQEIQSVLGLQQPQIFRSSPYRRNLHLKIQRVWSPASRRQGLRSFIKAQGNTAGLVYTRSRRESEQLAEWLDQQGYITDAYHAGLSPEKRRRIEEQWLSGGMPFVICTSAFGMGVDKSNCRWICHFHSPSTLSEYLQEIGRAGRDGQQSQTLLLASEPTGWLDPQDRNRQTAFQKQRRSQEQLAQKLVPKLPQEGNLSEILQQEPQAELALAILHQQKKLVWVDPFHYRLTDHAPFLGGRSVAPPVSMEAYLSTKSCRWQFLLRAFGFDREAQGTPCGHCDRCL
jgi:ATP-dependent DNA helicase RecQ